MRWPFRKQEQRTGFANPAQWLIDWVTGGKTVAGVPINEQTALQISAVWACVRLISETTSSLPLHVYKRTADGKERVPDHTLQRLLHDAPNPHMSAMTFRGVVQSQCLLNGNGYAEIVFNGGGVPAALYPIPSTAVKPELVDGVPSYVVTTVDGVVRLPTERMLHLLGPSPDGLEGHSPIRVARESLGLTTATEQFGAAFFGNGARSGVTLTHPGLIGAEATKNIRDSYDKNHKGTSNAHKTLVLEEGMTVSTTTVPPNDAQFLETRKFQVEEICRWYNIPPHMIQMLDHATFSNIEHQAIQFVTHSIRPWLVRWEQEIQRKLITDPSIFAEHNVEGLLRGDVKARYEAYAIGRNWGWLSANDIRRKENEPTLPEGDTYLQPLNMVDAANPGDPRADSLERSAAERAARKEFKLFTGPKEAAERALETHAGWLADVLAVAPEVSHALMKAAASMPLPTEATRDTWIAQRTQQILEVTHAARD